VDEVVVELGSIVEAELGPGRVADDLERLSENLFRFRDTCHVYVVRDGDDAVLVDFGGGDVLELLPALGITRVTDVLMTHHHRDQGQGLARAVAAGIRIWVPQAEQELFRGIDSHWQARELDNSYNNRQDRFSLLEPVPVAGTLDDYRSYRFGNTGFTVIPTPGHTTGAVTLLCDLDGRKLAFSGDLIAGPGKLWSLAATQWSYNGAEGVAATLASLLDLNEREREMLLPSHGLIMRNPGPAISLLCDRLRLLLRQRKQNPRLLELRERPFEVLSPHLLCNRTALAFHFVLLSDSGEALFIDFGYDFMVGTAAGSDRASRRPWLYTLAQLKRQFGVTKVEVVVPTHYHDDHVAGLNLLREVEGAEVWAASTFAEVLAHPWRFDLPCLWYDPIPVDRELPLETPIRWREFELTLHHQPGHTRYAVAISFTVDGQRVLAVGDQYEGGTEARWNYVYNNGFHPEDYRGSAALLERVRPDLLLAGHYLPHRVDEEFLEAVRGRGESLAEIHRDLLPVDELDFGGNDRAVSLRPYRSSVPAGRRLEMIAEVRNPFPRSERVAVELVAPAGWLVEPPRRELELPAGASATVTFVVVPTGLSVRRARVAADVTIGGRRLGQQAEALISVEPSTERTVNKASERKESRESR
jgi:glyoxylase-like metal-dependent hydrolase (beta-lactamase superfamily II)